MKIPARVWIASVASIAFCLFAAVICWWQPDSWAVFLIWPRWLWIVPGLLLAGLSWHRPAKRFGVVAGLVWLVYAGIFVEELHWHLRPSVPAGVPFRVVSLNCAGGNKLAAAEVIALNPDIAFFEESPSAREVAEVAHKLYGTDAGFAVNGDTSLIARGRVAPVDVARQWKMHFTEARVTLTNGSQVDAICVRLWPYNLRADVLTPDCWRDQADVRHRQRELMNWLIERMDSIPCDVPLIVGGDFNLAGNDAMMRMLKPRLHDTFLVAGTGLGNTLINEFPFVRIDQIWASDTVSASRVFVRRTINSDHRMVVADLVLPSNP